jgi:hypothetical protein
MSISPALSENPMVKVTCAERREKREIEKKRR